MNNVIFSGNLVNDIELKQTQEGKKYVTNKVAVSQFKDKNGNERPSLFFDFVVFGYDAETLSMVAHKGDRIVIMGRYEEDTNEKDGKTYVNKRIIASNVQVITKRPAQTSSNDDFEW